MCCVSAEQQEASQVPVKEEQVRIATHGATERQQVKLQA